MERSRIRSKVLPVLLAGCLAVAACGDDDAGSSEVTVPNEETASTPTSVRETTTTEDPTAAVEEAFYAQWDTYIQVGADPDPAATAIEDNFTGDARRAVADAISRLLAEGNAVRRPENPQKFKPGINNVEILDSTTAVVFECTLDGLVVFNTRTGDVVDDSVDEVAARNVFEFIDGRWKLAEITELEPGDPLCDF